MQPAMIFSAGRERRHHNYPAENDDNPPNSPDLSLDTVSPSRSHTAFQFMGPQPPRNQPSAVSRLTESLGKFVSTVGSSITSIWSGLTTEVDKINQEYRTAKRRAQNLQTLRRQSSTIATTTSTSNSTPWISGQKRVLLPSKTGEAKVPGHANRAYSQSQADSLLRHGKFGGIRKQTSNHTPSSPFGSIKNYLVPASQSSSAENLPDIITNNESSIHFVDGTPFQNVPTAIGAVPPPPPPPPLPAIPKVVESVGRFSSAGASLTNNSSSDESTQERPHKECTNFAEELQAKVLKRSESSSLYYWKTQRYEGAVNNDRPLTDAERFLLELKLKRQQLRPVSLEIAHRSPGGTLISIAKQSKISDSATEAVPATRVLKRSASEMCGIETPVNERIQKALRRKFAAIHALAESPAQFSERWSSPVILSDERNAFEPSPGKRLLNISMDRILPVSRTDSPVICDEEQPACEGAFQSAVETEFDCNEAVKSHII